MQASVREIKDNLSKYLRLISEGEEVTITSHNKPVARLQAMFPPPENLPNIPGVQWCAGKPDYSEPVSSLPKVKGATLADIVLKDRR